MEYTITLSDGKTISGLTLNGTIFVSKTKIDESIFVDNLSTITISDGKNEYAVKNVVFVHQMEQKDGWYIAFRLRTEEEKRKMEIDTKINNITDIINVLLGVE